MAVLFIRRRLQRHFGISAARMTVTTDLPWWGRGAVLVAVTALIGAVVWWAFDFGKLFGHVNGRELDARYAVVEMEASRLRTDASTLRVQNSQLESDLAMSRGAERALSREVTALATGNTQLKEDAAALRRLIADTERQAAGRRR